MIFSLKEQRGQLYLNIAHFSTDKLKYPFRGILICGGGGIETPSGTWSDELLLR